jgi:hypothetical protein
MNLSNQVIGTPEKISLLDHALLPCHPERKRREKLPQENDRRAVKYPENIST